MGPADAGGQRPDQRLSGAGGKTVLPNRASVKITCRLVPKQNPEKIGDALAAYLRALVPPGVTFELISRSTGSPPAITPIDSAAMAAAAEAMEMAFGKKPVLQREGGSIPVVAWFKQALGIDTVLLGFGLPDDQIHAPTRRSTCVTTTPASNAVRRCINYWRRDSHDARAVEKAGVDPAACRLGIECRLSALGGGHAVDAG